MPGIWPASAAARQMENHGGLAGAAHGDVADADNRRFQAAAASQVARAIQLGARKSKSATAATESKGGLGRT